MTTARTAITGILTSVAVFAPLLSVGATGARAAEPWWHVATISSPAAPNSTEARINVDIANLGDTKTSGTWLEHLLEAGEREETKGFITVVDRLPAGVTATDVHAEGGGTNFGRTREHEMENFLKSFFGSSLELCSITGQTVECKYGTPVRPYEHIILAISAKVDPGAGRGENEVSVSGGGAPPVTSKRPLAGEQPLPSYGVQTYELMPEEEGGLPATQAGAHPFQLTTTLFFNSESAFHTEPVGGSENHYEVRPLAMTKDLRVNLPPGLVGNPTPLPKCSLYVFSLGTSEKSSCPGNTVVGVATPILDNHLSEEADWVPYAIMVPLYSLEPSAGEPAKFGFQTPAGPVILDTSVRTGGDYGVVVTVSNITQVFPFIGSVVSFWGVPADKRHDNSRNFRCIGNVQSAESGGEEPSCSADEKAKPLLISPTSCSGPWHSWIEADSWSAPGQFTEPFAYIFQNGAGEPIGQDGCNLLNFEPSISVKPDGEQASTPTGLKVEVHVPQEASLNPEGLAESAVKDTTVTLPAGVALNPAGADGLLACGLGEIAIESPAEQTCPEAAKVATVKIKTPLLPNELEGAAYLATPAPFGEPNMNPFSSLLALYIVVKDPVSGVLVKLAGEVTSDEHTGQLTATFKDTPQLPFENLHLDFFGGSRAPLSTPALCGSYATTASITPWSGNAPAEISSPPFEITTGPNGNPCSSPLPFSPSLHASSTNIQAGAFTPLTTTMSREDGQQPLQGLQLHFPPGLSGLLSGVALCGEAQANEGTCGPESLIGETTVSVGLGSTPFSVKGGRVYITGPYEGAPFGLSIVNPAKAGPFDLEKGTSCDCVVVRAKVDVDPSTAQLTITTDNTGPYKIPTILKGIPLQIKHVNVTITRPGFTINPTNCSPMSITGSIASTEGATSALSVPFQVTNCATLKFAPKFQVSTSGKTSKANGASLTAKLSYPNAPQGTQANITQVKVNLPRQLPSRLTTLQKACLASVFAANPASCPAASIIGHAKVITPLLPVPLTGPAYFVSHGGEAFPSLTIVLQGYGVTIDLVATTFISKAGITSTTFKTVPDTPFNTFELTLPQGKFSALAANANLCKVKGGLKMPTLFKAQNGAVVHQSTKIAVSGCAKHKARNRHRKGKRHRKRRK